MEPADVAVEVPLVGDPRRKNWAKVVRRVDDSRSSGWAFEGEFIASGGIQDVPIGSVLVVYGEKGSRATPQMEARVYVVNSDGTLTHHTTATGRAWARTIRDPVAELLEREPPTVHSDWHPDLTRYTDQALAEELRRRGYDVSLD
jgi:hypothetical protein